FLMSVSSCAKTKIMVSRKSGTFIKIFAFPGPGPKFAMELFERAPERLDFAPLAARGCILGGHLFEVIANQAGQSRISIDRKLSQLFDYFLVERKRNIHVHIIRETLITC